MLLNATIQGPCVTEVMSPDNHDESRSNIFSMYSLHRLSILHSSLLTLPLSRAPKLPNYLPHSQPNRCLTATLIVEAHILHHHTTRHRTAAGACDLPLEPPPPEAGPSRTRFSQFTVHTETSRVNNTRAPHLQENAPPLDPTVGLCLGY